MLANILNLNGSKFSLTHHMVGCCHARKHSEHFEAQLLLKTEFFILYSYRACCLTNTFCPVPSERREHLKSRTEPAQNCAF